VGNSITIIAESGKKGKGRSTQGAVLRPGIVKVRGRVGSFRVIIEGIRVKRESTMGTKEKGRGPAG